MNVKQGDAAIGYLLLKHTFSNFFVSIKGFLNDVVQLFYLEKSAVQFQHWLGKMTISTKVLHIISTGWTIIKVWSKGLLKFIYSEKATKYMNFNFKRNLWYPQFFQKTNKKIRLCYYDTSGRLVFVRFLEESEDTKKTFQN